MSEGVSLRKNHPQTCSDAFSDHHAFCEFIIELNLNKIKAIKDSLWVHILPQIQFS